MFAIIYFFVRKKYVTYYIDVTTLLPFFFFCFTLVTNFQIRFATRTFYERTARCNRR